MKLCSIALSSLLALLTPVLAFSAPKPNVLLIISDDLGARLGCYGDPIAKTPNIDALAKRGVRFDNACAQYTVCNPSRTSFLSGLRPEESGVWGNEIAIRSALPNVVTLPQALKEGGYFTAGFGKVFHVGAKSAEAPVRMDQQKSWSLSEYISSLGNKNTLKMGASGVFTGGKGASNSWGEILEPEETNPDHQIATRAIEAMKKAGDKPWFIAAGFHQPHSPYYTQKKYFDLYPLSSIKLYNDPATMTPTLKAAIPPGGNFDLFSGFTRTDKQRFVQGYYACVSMMDAQVGRLMDELKKTGADANTIVIFMGDNGFHLGERQWWNKVTLFQRSSQIPFIVAGPNVVAGAVCKSPIELLDIYPTLVERTGVSTAQKLSGQSIQPLLANPELPGKGYAFSMVARGKSNMIGRSVKTAKWRYTEWDQGKEGVELYDTEKDPNENHDLSKNPEYKETLDKMKALFEKLPVIDPKFFAPQPSSKGGAE